MATCYRDITAVSVCLQRCMHTPLRNARLLTHWFIYIGRDLYERRPAPRDYYSRDMDYGSRDPYPRDDLYSRDMYARDRSPIGRRDDYGPPSKRYASIYTRPLP